MEELRDRLESWITGNGHEVDEYEFEEPVYSQLRATFDRMEMTLMKLKTSFSCPMDKGEPQAA